MKRSPQEGNDFGIRRIPLEAVGLQFQKSKQVSWILNEFFTKHVENYENKEILNRNNLLTINYLSPLCINNVQLSVYDCKHLITKALNHKVSQNTKSSAKLAIQ